MINPKRNVNTFAPMSAQPLPSGYVFRLIDGLRCPICTTILRCDPEPLAEGIGLQLICTGCHRDIIVVD